MVRNKGELVAAANAWMGEATRDIAQKMGQFMNATGLTAADIAGLLDADVQMINGILNKTCDIPMSLFAKILISTGHAVQIVPEKELEQAMRRGRGKMPQRNGEWNAPNIERDARGRFVPRGGASVPREDLPSRGGFVPPMPSMPEGGFVEGYPMPNMEQAFGMVPQQANQETAAPHEGEVRRVANANPNNAGANDAAINALFEAVQSNPQLAGLFGAVLDKLNQ